MSNLIFETKDNENEFYSAALDDIVFSIKEALQDYKECRVGLSGGTTPEKLYAKLAQQDLPWERIRFIVIDERYVPSDNMESNLGMIRKSLFNKVKTPPDMIIAFDTSLPIESAAKDMSRKMIALSHSRFPIFDLLILGAGTDGHIASLFPDDSAMHCPYYSCVAKAEGYKTEERLTLSLISLKSSSKCLLLLKGHEKQKLFMDLQDQTKRKNFIAISEIMSKMPFKTLYLK